MVRLLLVLSLLLSGGAGALPAMAQDTATTGPKIGEPATVYGANGEPIGEVKVTAITDPFEDYDPVSSQPPRGYHWAQVAVSLSAGSQVLPVNYSGFTMVDNEGFVAYQGYVSRSAESAAAQPDLQTNQVEPGQTSTGVIFFQVFGDSTISLIEYAPTYEQSVVVVDQREARVAPGDVVAWNAGNGAPLGELSLSGVVDPLQDFDPSYPPQRGFRYVGVAVSFTSLGTRPVTISSYSFSVIDHEGFVSSTAGVYRTAEGTAALPDLPYTEVAPGARISGVVTFQLISGATIKDVIFAPQGDRRLRIAEFDRGATYTQPELTPVATVVVDPACEAVLVWADQIINALAPLSDAFELVDQVSEGGTVEPQALRDAADLFDEVADALDDLDTPEAAQATSEQYAAALHGAADGIRTLADDVEAENADNIAADVSLIYAQVFGLTGGAYSELVARCPGVAS